MATRTMNYTAETAVFTTTALDSLAASSTWLAGYESAVIDNTSNKFLDVILSGQFKTNNTPPTAGEIRVYVGSLIGDSAYPDVFDGTASAETVTSAEIRDSCLKLVHTISTTTTANQVYPFTGIGLAQWFGGVMPPKWFVFITQSTAQALNVTANNGGQVYYQGIKEDIA